MEQTKNIVLSTRLLKPAKGHEDKVHKQMRLMENKPRWKGNWYAWENEIKMNKYTTNKYRLKQLLKDGTHEINSIMRDSDGDIFEIGDIICHKETTSYNFSEILAFRIVENNYHTKMVIEVSFKGLGGKLWTSRLDQIDKVYTSEMEYDTLIISNQNPCKEVPMSPDVECNIKERGAPLNKKLLLL